MLHLNSPSMTGSNGTEICTRQCLSFHAQNLPQTTIERADAWNRHFWPHFVKQKTPTRQCKYAKQPTSAHRNLYIYIYISLSLSIFLFSLLFRLTHFLGLLNQILVFLNAWRPFIQRQHHQSSLTTKFSRSVEPTHLNMPSSFCPCH